MLRKSEVFNFPEGPEGALLLNPIETLNNVSDVKLELFSSITLVNLLPVEKFTAISGLRDALIWSLVKLLLLLLLCNNIPYALLPFVVIIFELNVFEFDVLIVIP